MNSTDGLPARRGARHWDKVLDRRQVLGGIGAAGLLILSACTAGKATGDASGGSGAPGGTATKSSTPDAQLSFAIPDGTGDVSPATPLVVTAAGGTIASITVTADDGTVVNGVPDAAKMTWTNTDPLAYGSAYTVAATATNPDGKTTQKSSSFSTVKASALVFPSIAPLDGMTVGVGLPVRVYFEKAAADRKVVEQALKVTTTPAQTGSWSWISDTEVHWRPQVYFQAGTTVQVDVNIFGVPFAKGAYGKVNRSIKFTVGDAVISTADTQTHQMTVTKNGQVLKTIPIAAGKEVPGRYTHNGVHVVTDKKAQMTMDSTTYGLALDAGGYQTQVQWATRISNNGEFVHSAPWSVADQGVRNVSHGCLNASPANAKWFFDMSTPGDVVEVTGSPVPLTEADGDIFCWTMSWDQWVKGSALK